jgi:transposase
LKKPKQKFPVKRDERRGGVLEIARGLLEEGRKDEVLELFGKLVERNSQLERIVALAKAQRGKKNEGTSASQLILMLDGLKPESAEGLEEANRKLREASKIDEACAEIGNQVQLTAQRQPSLRKPLPAHLRRVDNPLAVPAAERRCPKCGAERICFGHEVTEVLDLIPAEVIVRVDRREKLACQNCEGELVRAPAGDRVVSGGRMGTGLVAQILVEKYRDGLPLHRQKERYERLGVELPVSTLADQVTWAHRPAAAAVARRARRGHRRQGHASGRHRARGPRRSAPGRHQAGDAVGLRRRRGWGANRGIPLHLDRKEGRSTSRRAWPRGRAQGQDRLHCSRRLEPVRRQLQTGGADRVRL